MKILVVSGFLGAGKTTFIREMIRRCGIKPVVLENEYGQTDVDAQILSASDAADVWGLQEGCICCTKSADMANSVIAIENVLDPELLVIEPSGIAKLGNVIGHLKKLEYERIGILKPITIVDAPSFERDMRAFPDICEDQVRSAGTVFFSKLGSVSPEEVALIEEKVRALNPGAEIVSSRYEEMDAAGWKALLTASFSGGFTETDDAPPPGLETVALPDCVTDSPVALLSVLKNALWGKYGAVIRAKGLVPCGDELLQFDLAGGIARVTGHDGPAEPECVWIGYGIDRGLLEEAFGTKERAEGCGHCHDRHGHHEHDGHDRRGHGHEGPEN